MKVALQASYITYNKKVHIFSPLFPLFLPVV